MTGISRTSYPGTWASGDTILASENNAGPGGLVASDFVISAATAAGGTLTGISTTAVICSVTYTPTTATRRLVWEANGKVRLPGSIAAAPVGSSFQSTLRLDGTVINRINWPIPFIGIDCGFHVTAYADSPAASSHTWDLVVGVNGSTGPINVIATSGAPAGPCYLLLNDVGIAF